MFLIKSTQALGDLIGRHDAVCSIKKELCSITLPLLQIMQARFLPLNNKVTFEPAIRAQELPSHLCGAFISCPRGLGSINVLLLGGQTGCPCNKKGT